MHLVTWTLLTLMANSSPAFGGTRTDRAQVSNGVESLLTVELGGTFVSPCEAPERMVGCLIRPLAGLTAFVDGFDHNATASALNTTHCVCTLPPADAEAPVNIFFYQAKVVENKLMASGVSSLFSSLIFAGTARYVALWTTAFTRRPYLSIDSYGGLIIGTHPMVQDGIVSMQMDAGQRGMLLSNASLQQSGVSTTVPFSLSLVPASVQLLPIVVSLHFHIGPRTVTSSRRLFLSRVQAPSAKYTGSLVQVDYSRKALLVNGNLLSGVGYYDSQSIGPSNLTRQAAAGLTWGMRYLNDPPSNMSRRDDKWILDYFDWSHASGMYVMFDISFMVEALMKRPETFNTTWTNITDEIARFREHPALLGYYICDDCTTQYLMVQEKQPHLPNINTIYKMLKELDPYHPVIGADECLNVYTFTTANKRVPDGPSLDLVMVENYVDSLRKNAHWGTPRSPGMDGSFDAWPLTWEPIVNCPGPWLVAQNLNQHYSADDKALVMYSMSWLSAVLANLPLQLDFRLFPFPGTNQSAPLIHLPIYEHILWKGVGRYGKVVNSRDVQKYLFAPPSGMLEPRVEVISASSSVGDCDQCARIWRRDSQLDSNSFCVLVVVVNTWNTTATVRLRLKTAVQWRQAQTTTLRRVDGVGHVAFHRGELRLRLDAYDTHVYVTDNQGCDRLTEQYSAAGNLASAASDNLQYV